MEMKFTWGRLNMLILVTHVFVFLAESPPVSRFGCWIEACLSSCRDHAVSTRLFT